MKIDLYEFKYWALRQIGKPYKYGSKWDINDPDPIGPVDCSGFTRWLMARLGITIPDGSSNQFSDSVLLNPQSLAGPGDLGFFKHMDGDIHHVGLIFDDENVIEARGDPFGAVILRPRIKWEKWHEFTGWHRIPELEA